MVSHMKTNVPEGSRAQMPPKDPIRRPNKCSELQEVSTLHTVHVTGPDPHPTWTLLTFFTNLLQHQLTSDEVLPYFLQHFSHTTLHFMKLHLIRNSLLAQEVAKTCDCIRHPNDLLTRDLIHHALTSDSYVLYHYTWPEVIFQSFV